jgi:nitrous oxide reductase accessory protein NosL
MKTKTMFALMAIATVMAFTACNKPAQKSEAKPVAPVTAKVTYTCPMDTDVVQDHPGKCPKCGMDLVKK